jgi:hypothetical protein
MFTRKHFDVIAEVISKELLWFQNPNGNKAIRTVARSLADKFADDNPRFDREKFYAACGLTETSTKGIK